MNNQPISFKILQIVHAALCTGVILFIAVTFLVTTRPAHFNLQADDVPLLHISIALAATMAPISNWLYQRRLAGINQSASTTEKFNQYFSASITRYAPLEAAALFNVVVWFLNSNLII